MDEQSTHLPNQLPHSRPEEQRQIHLHSSHSPPCRPLTIRFFPTHIKLHNVPRATRLGRKISRRRARLLGALAVGVCLWPRCGDTVSGIKPQDLLCAKSKPPFSAPHPLLVFLPASHTRVPSTEPAACLCGMHSAIYGHTHTVSNGLLSQQCISHM